MHVEITEHRDGFDKPATKGPYKAYLDDHAFEIVNGRRVAQHSKSVLKIPKGRTMHTSGNKYKAL